MITRKEYAEQKKVTERTVKNWQEALGLDKEKAVLSDDDVETLDFFKSRLDAGCKISDVVEEIKQRKRQVETIGENPFVGLIRDDLLGSAVSAAIPLIPQWTVEILMTRRDELKRAFEQYFAAPHTMKQISQPEEVEPAPPQLPPPNNKLEPPSPP